MRSIRNVVVKWSVRMGNGLREKKWKEYAELMCNWKKKTGSLRNK